jgi:hypothetical protein
MLLRTAGRVPRAAPSPMRCDPGSQRRNWRSSRPSSATMLWPSQGVEEALQPRRRNLDAGFERQREVGAIVFGQGESEQGLHACQQSGIAAQFRPGQEQRCRAGHL